MRFSLQPVEGTAVITGNFEKKGTSFFKEKTSGVIHEIGEALHVGGGQKEEDKHKGEHHSGDHYTTDVHHQQQHHGGEQREGEHKEGLVDKIKQKIPGARRRPQ
ncbi:hypothetical protein AB3S75_032799 [Citrus x aurantiifolia]